MSDDPNKQDDFNDDFADDFADDFGDDFSDDLSEETVGFDDADSSASDFTDETVVYDEEVNSGANAAAFNEHGSSLSDYKKYVVMAFTFTLGIVFFAMMVGKKKKTPESPLPEPASLFAEQTKQASKPKEMAEKPEEYVDPLKHLREPATNPAPVTPVNSLDQLAPQPQPRVAQAPVIAPPAPAPQINSDQLDKIFEETKVMSERLSSVQAQFKSNRSNFSQLNSTLSTLERSVRQANAALTQLDDNVKGIKSELKKQQKYIDSMKQKKKSMASGKVYKPGMEMVSTPKYYLYAAIPGRAWLKSESGTTLTIAIGSNIPGYGRVNLIEPVKGMVITNKGHIFRFAER